MKRQYYELSNLKRKLKKINPELNKQKQPQKPQLSAYESAKRLYAQNQENKAKELAIISTIANENKKKAIKRRAIEKRQLFKKHKNGQPCLSTKMNFMLKKIYSDTQ